MAGKKCCKENRLVWSISNTPQGFTFETWEPDGTTDPATKDGFLAVWGGPKVDGIPTHTDGAPTSSGVETDTRFSQSEQGQDEHRLCYWFYNDRAVPIEIQDIDTRAESFQVYVGCDCPSALTQERYQTGTGSPYHSQGVPFLTLPAGGLTKVTVLIHDPGNDFSGFRPVANEVGSADTFDPLTYQSKPSLLCRIQEFDPCNPEELVEGESYKPLIMNCFDCEGAAGLTADEVLTLVGPHVELSDTAPVPDQDGPLAVKRQASAGTSAQASRADHNHPIIRLPNPGDPVITVSGNGITLVQSLILDRESTEEWYAFKFRIRVSRTAGNSWHQINVPQLAGFQQRMLYAIGNYRSVSTSPQDDDASGAGGTGATPRGPYMGKEWHEWSSTGRLYGGIYRRDNDIPTEFVEFWVKYICA